VWKESDKQFTQGSEMQQYKACADVQSVGVSKTKYNCLRCNNFSHKW